MLAHYPRRQRPSSSFITIAQHHHGLPSPPPSAAIPPLLSSDCDGDYEHGNDLDPDSTPAAHSHHLYSLSSPDYYMPTTPSYHPPIRVHQSTPSPGPPSLYRPSRVEDQSRQPPAWLQFNHLSHLAPQAGHQRFHTQGQPFAHKRHSSGSSSVASAGPASPYTPSGAFPQILDADLTSYPSPSFDSFDNQTLATASYPKSIPSAHIPTFTESLLAPQYQDYYTGADDAQSHLVAMRQAFMAQQDTSMENASSAQRSSYDAQYDDGFKVPPEVRSNMPKLDRTMSDIYQDELYNPNIVTSMPTSQPPPPVPQNHLLSPHRDVFSERLQAANNSHISARSDSPTTSISRERSPFRPDSQFAAEAYSHSNSPIPRIGSAAQLREQQRATAAAHELAQHRPSAAALQSPRTISPKEALLDYDETTEDSKGSLFPKEASTARGVDPSPQYASLKPVKQEALQSDMGEPSTQQSFRSMATTRRESSSNYSSTSGFGQSRAKGATTSPSCIQVPQQYPFISQSRRQTSSMQSASDQSPEFPASLTSMESTKSEGAFRSSQEQTEGPNEIQRPARTMADSGTYTCTYHGCTQRFETPAKLQKHKRDGHRQTTPPTGSTNPTVGNSPSAAAILANRNSQAGPHKCDRINPSTGKPCNSVFSRPYDLTRHEDTIHNARKQKVRCQLCTEDKTFSRNDALTRHMRVVHPEVDFPGKTKRKGGN